MVSSQCYTNRINLFNIASRLTRTLPLRMISFSVAWLFILIVNPQIVNKLQLLVWQSIICRSLSEHKQKALDDYAPQYKN